MENMLLVKVIQVDFSALPAHKSAFSRDSLSEIVSIDAGVLYSSCAVCVTPDGVNRRIREFKQRRRLRLRLRATPRSKNIIG